MTSTEWVDVIINLYDYIYGLAIYIYPVSWALKIAKKVLASGL